MKDELNYVWSGADGLVSNGVLDCCDYGDMYLHTGLPIRKAKAHSYMGRMLGYCQFYWHSCSRSYSALWKVLG